VGWWAGAGALGLFFVSINITLTLVSAPANLEHLDLDRGTASARCRGAVVPLPLRPGISVRVSRFRFAAAGGRGACVRHVVYSVQPTTTATESDRDRADEPTDSRVQDERTGVKRSAARNRCETGRRQARTAASTVGKRRKN
jgi:hypothetical protein